LINWIYQMLQKELQGPLVAHWHYDVQILFRKQNNSQCSLRKKFKFLQNFRSKNNTIIEKFWPKFWFNIWHGNSGLTFNSKNYYIISLNCLFHKRKFSKLTSKMNVSFVNEALDSVGNSMVVTKYINHSM
jgi:hypothetical protein